MSLLFSKASLLEGDDELHEATYHNCAVAKPTVEDGMPCRPRISCLYACRCPLSLSKHDHQALSSSLTQASSPPIAALVWAILLCRLYTGLGSQEAAVAADNHGIYLYLCTSPFLSFHAPNRPCVCHPLVYHERAAAHVDSLHETCKDPPEDTNQAEDVWMVVVAEVVIAEGKCRVRGGRHAQVPWELAERAEHPGVVRRGICLAVRLLVLVVDATSSATYSPVFLCRRQERE